MIPVRVRVGYRVDRSVFWRELAAALAFGALMFALMML